MHGQFGVCVFVECLVGDAIRIEDPKKKALNGGGSDDLPRGLPRFHQCLFLVIGIDDSQILFGLNSSAVVYENCCCLL